MRQITDPRELIGKTIQGVCQCGDFVMNLGDGEYVRIEPQESYGSLRLEWKEPATPYELNQAGVITQAEQIEMERKEHERFEEGIKARELQTLRELRKKYPEGL
jgi:hypothetical protein